MFFSSLTTTHLMISLHKSLCSHEYVYQNNTLLCIHTPGPIGVCNDVNLVGGARRLSINVVYEVHLLLTVQSCKK